MPQLNQNNPFFDRKKGLFWFDNSSKKFLVKAYTFLPITAFYGIYSFQESGINAALKHSLIAIKGLLRRLSI